MLLCTGIKVGCVGQSKYCEAPRLSTIFMAVHLAWFEVSPFENDFLFPF